jgi:hypothetical protein
MSLLLGELLKRRHERPLRRLSLFASLRGRGVLLVDAQQFRRVELQRTALFSRDLAGDLDQLVGR